MALHCSRACRQYLLHVAQDNIEFRLPEIKALLSLRGKQFCPAENFKERSPFWVLNNVSEDDVLSIMGRTVCAKSVFELWGHGRTPSELQASLQKYPADDMAPFIQKESTYKINVYTFNKTLVFKDRIKKIDALEFLPFQGKVNLKNPEHIFCLLEDYGSDPNNIPDEPFYVYFGRWIADGQRVLIRSHSVKTRHFIGNTSMDAGLSFIMANHAGVKAHDLVFDPFVGTGSLLVACSHFGAYVCGTDIDYNTIHGIGKASRKNQKWRGPDENIRANLRQYGTEKFYVDVLVSDSSKAIWRQGPLFDAIITDPPYGIRESTRRTGSQKESSKPAEDLWVCSPTPTASSHSVEIASPPVSSQYCPSYPVQQCFPTQSSGPDSPHFCCLPAPSTSGGESHVPVSMAYHLSDIFSDLLSFAAHCLVIGGRLVYWLPVYRPEYREEIVPLHPCLRLVSNCEQTLSSHTSRRLITMEKMKEVEDSDKEALVLESRFSPYQGHNAFREKYFSGITKRSGKSDGSTLVNGSD